MELTLSRTSSAPPRGEDYLVAAARAGDDQAFGELYSRYQGRIGAFIRSRVQDHGRAEDIAQEVFISALRRLRASEQTIAFKPWIYEIAKNACIDEFRRAQRGREVSLDADEELSSGRRGLLALGPTPPVAVESKQRLDDLQGAFGGLSENHHQLLVMREFEGLSYGEIGARTGMSRQMVESTLFRARRKLSQEYDELASGRRCEQVQSAIETGRVHALHSFGIRERRQLTRHLSYCQPCRREARLAGVDESVLRRRSVAAKIAALLPFPLWRWPWRGGGTGSGKSALGSGGSNHAAAAQSLQSAAGAAAPAGSSVTLSQAAAAAAALAIAGAGGGIVTGVWSPGHPTRPVSRTTVRSHSGSAAGTRLPRGVLGTSAPSTLRQRHHPAAKIARPARSRTSRSQARLHHSIGRTASTSPSRTSATSSRSPGTASPTQPAGSASTGSSAPGTVSGVTHPTVSTVGKVLHNTVNSLPGTVSGLLHQVLPPSGSGISVPGSGISVPGSGISVPGSGISVPGSGISGPGSGISVPGVPGTNVATGTAQQLGSTVSGLASGVLPPGK